MIRAALLLSSYLTGVWGLLVMVCVLPERALALVSPQAYARVVAEAEWIAYQAATKPQVVQAVASAASAASPASLAIRAVAGPVGWAALGVTAGMLLYQTFYPDQTLTDLKEAARPAGSWTIQTSSAGTVTVPSPAGQNGEHAVWTNTIGSPCADTFYGAGAFDWMIGPYSSNGGPSWPPLQSWEAVQAGQYPGIGFFWCHFAGVGSSVTTNPGAAPTAQQVADYLGALPADSPLAVEQNSRPLGQGKTADQAAQTQVTPVSPAQMPTTVKPTAQVAPTDIVVATNVPPPAGTTTTTPTTQQSTTTTTTVTNPDGSTTQTKTSTASASCTEPGGHEERTLGSILAAHQATWTSSGLIGAVNLLKTLTWPTTLPVVELPSTVFGTQQVDFNQWAWAFTALRTLLIAVASLAAYRLIVVGG